MVAIRKLSIEGFRSIRAIRDLELRPLNVLIGANGSGKSNFLKSAHAFADSRPGRFPNVRLCATLRRRLTVSFILAPR